jgi:hypothetical protein
VFATQLIEKAIRRSFFVNSSSAPPSSLSLKVLSTSSKKSGSAEFVDMMVAVENAVAHLHLRSRGNGGPAKAKKVSSEAIQVV